MSMFLTFWEAIKKNPGTSIGSLLCSVVGILAYSGLVTTPAGIGALAAATAIGHLFAGDASASTPSTVTVIKSVTDMATGDTTHTTTTGSAQPPAAK